MGEFGPTLIAGEECAVDGGTVKVTGHGIHLLVPHLDVEITVGDSTEVAQWHNEDSVEIGSFLYIVHFKTFERFAPGLPVANLVLIGDVNDPAVRRAEAAAAAAEDSAAVAGGLAPLT